MVKIDKHLIFYPLNLKNIALAPSAPGVYMIKNILNDKCYVGSAKNIKYRLQQHLRDFLSEKHINKYLLRAFNKYGQDSFVYTILERCEEDRCVLLSTEQIYLNMSPEYNYMKIAGTTNGYKHTDETKKMLAEKHKGKPHVLNSEHIYSEPKCIKDKPKVKKPTMEKPVLQYTLDGEFIAEHCSIIEASRKIKRYYSGIGSACRGKFKQAYGFIWRYKIDKNYPKKIGGLYA